MRYCRRFATAALVLAGAATSPEPMSAAASSFAYVSNCFSNEVKVIAIATNTVVAEIYVAPGSYGLTYGEDAVWVTSTERSTVARVDPRTNLVVETIPVGKSPHGVFMLKSGPAAPASPLSPAGGPLRAVSTGSGTTR